MIEVLGVFFSVILAASAIPQATKCLMQGHTKGMSPLFIITWFVGSLGTATYMLYKFGYDPAIIANYGICTTCATIVLGVYINERA